MKREEKNEVIELLKNKFTDADHFYVTDASTLTVADVNDFRRLCFDEGVEYKVAKNTLVKKALDACEVEYNEDVYNVFVGPTSIIFSDVANKPAKILKQFRTAHEKPVLKAAFIDSELYLGDEQIEVLAKLKSKEELVGEIIGLLQSPIRNVMASLNSGGNKLSGILKTLSERDEN